MSSVTDQFLRQLDTLIEEYTEANSTFDEFGEERQPFVDAADYSRLMTSLLAAIERVAGVNSTYSRQASRGLGQGTITYWEDIVRVAGIAMALRSDVAAGFLDSARELIHGEIFSDFLEMAEHLWNEGYKDAAAVIGGGVLESHLRALCMKNGVAVEYTANGQTNPKRAERLNADLKAADVYGILDQKNITSWLDLRNKAAHAKYGEYTREQVDLMVNGVREWIARHPA